jgi:transposase-like protein
MAAITYRRYYQDRTDVLRVKVFPEVECIVPNTVSNRKGMSIFLRSLYEEGSGKHLISLPWLSTELGYKDRRNSHNFWAEFQASDYDFQAFMQRRRKVSNPEVVGFIQEQWVKDVGVSIKEMKQRIEKRFSIKVTESTVRKAASQVEVIPILRAVHRQLDKGQRRYKQGWLLKQVFEGALLLGQQREGEEEAKGFEWSAYVRHQIEQDSAEQAKTMSRRRRRGEGDKEGLELKAEDARGSGWEGTEVGAKTVADKMAALDKIQSREKVREEGQWENKTDPGKGSGWQVAEAEADQMRANPKLEQMLFQQDPPESVVEESWRSPLGVTIWMCLLSYHGVSLEVIGRWFSVNKTTVYRRVKQIGQMNLGWIADLGRGSFSGVANVDELYMTIAGVCYYLFVAIDPPSQYVLHWQLMPSNGAFYCVWFLLTLRLKGFHPKAIVSDGLPGYAFAIPLCFGLQCKHQRCLFHILRNACRKLKSLVKDELQRAEFRNQLLELFDTSYKRTVLCRLQGLNEELKEKGVGVIGEYLVERMPKLLYGVGSCVIPLTGNAIERFFRGFRHFEVRKYGFYSFATAQDQIALYMIGYTLEQLHKKVQQEPEKWANHPLARTLLYKMWTEPRVSVLMYPEVPEELIEKVEHLKAA